MQNVGSSGIETEAESLASEVIAFSGSEESRLFYLKKISELGPGLVREAMGEVRMRENLGGVQDRARYLNRVLTEWAGQRGLTQTPIEPPVRPAPWGLTQTPPPSMFSFDEFEPDPAGESTAPMIPFRSDVFPWVLHVNNDCFSLTNEKAKSDKVKTNIVVNGQIHAVTMIRGKKGRNDAERGIHTTEHMRVLMAAVQIWKRINPPPIRDKNSRHRICAVETTIRDIALEMGLGKIGGVDYKRLEQKLQDLASSGYTFLLRDVPGLRAKGYDDKSFQFFGEVDTTGVVVNGRRETRIKIFFSSRYSEWLLRRKVVTRPLEMMRIRGDIALKLYVYLYPILIQKKPNEDFSIELKRLIPALGLKLAGWHMFKSQRKREFEKALPELNGLPSTDGRVFSAEIIQGLNKEDFLLAARLKSP